MTRIQFNTGRGYSPEGQRIVAVHENGEILFNDIDRGITGVVVCQMQHLTESELEEMLMYAYDRGMYVGSFKAEDLEWKS